ncbi:MAG: hypothetical protein WBA59_05865 [Moheibacter sp.]
MKKIILLAFAVCTVMLLSFTNHKSFTDFDLTSPAGFTIAKDLQELKQLLRTNTDSEIVSIEYKDAENYNLATITFTENNGKTISKLIVRTKEGNGYSSKVFSCSGCSNECAPIYVESPSGNFVKCTKACCILNVGDGDDPIGSE